MKLFRTIEAVADGNYNVGDVIAFTLNDGEEVEALAVKQEQDGMIFCLVDCLRKEYSMNPTSSNRGGYKSCALRKVAFPNGDLLRLPTEREIFGENIYGVEEDDSVEQWEPMKKRKNRIAFQGKGTDTWEWYWLQNKYDGSAACFACVSGNGNANYYPASISSCVRPAFKI